MAAIYSAYGDESSDEKCKRVFAASGIFGRQEEWDNLSKAWFKRTKDIDFHAADCESDKGNFEQTEHRENLKLYRDLTEMLCQTKLIGYAIAISLEAHHKHFPGHLESSPYLLCFAHVVTECAEAGRVSMPAGKVKFTFDRHFDHQYNATKMYEWFTKAKWVRSHPYLEGEVAFTASQGYAQIQVADLVAREAMKRLDRDIVGGSFTRRSMEALLKTGRFRFTYLRDADFADLARGADELSRSVKGATKAEYQKWLANNGYPDTHELRMHYMMNLPHIKEKLLDRSP